MPENPWNTTVPTSTFGLGTELSIASAAVKTAINALFSEGGLSLEEVIEQKVPWLHLNELILNIFDGYAAIELTP